MNNRTILSIALIAILLVTAAGPVAAKPFRVAVVMPSAINDYAWGQSMYDALKAVQNEMGKDHFRFVYSENMYNPSDANAAIRDYASQGYDLVIAHGSQYGSSLVDIAPDFPETSFAWGSTANTFADRGINNIYAYEPHAEQGGFVNGVLAATISESSVFGCIGPIQTGDAKRYMEGYEAGIKHGKPKATVNVTWTGSYGDVSLAAEAAQTHLNEGADVLTGTSQMVVGAIGVVKDRGARWFAYDVNQAPLAPNSVVASTVVHFEVALRRMISNVKQGTLGQEILPLTFENGGLEIALNDRALDAGTRNRLREIKNRIVQQINRGELELP